MNNSCDAQRVFISGHQTLGRGQVDAKWMDMPDKNALFTVTMPAAGLPIRHLPRWNMWFSSRVATALRSQCNLPIALKWPNDIMLYDKKIGGMLIETILRGNQLRCIVAGNGINVGYAPEEIPHSDCLYHYVNITVEEVIHCVLRDLIRHPFTENCVEDYHNLLLGHRHWHTYLHNGIRRQGMIEEVNDAGCACIRWEDSGQMGVYRHKEVQWCYD